MIILAPADTNANPNWSSIKVFIIKKISITAYVWNGVNVWIVDDCWRLPCIWVTENVLVYLVITFVYISKVKIWHSGNIKKVYIVK